MPGRKQLHLAELLDFRPAQGIIHVHDQRVVILSAAAMELLRKELVDGPNVRLRDRPPEITQKPRHSSADDTLDLREQEHVMIERALDRFGGNRKRAAEALKISTVALWRRMKQYGLSS